jgi:hypothetical protein
MQRIREILALLLIVGLPFHALAVTVLTKLIAGPGQAPLGMLALWKEGLLAIILLMAVSEILRSRQALKNALQMDLIDRFILALIVLAIGVSVVRETEIASLALGIKYDFLPLIAFLILRHVPWSEEFKARVITIIVWTGGIVAAYGILTFFLPLTFFTALGYSDLHSLYVPGGPLAAYQQIGGELLRRVQSTFSGPNQFGLWLLLPFSLATIRMLPRVIKKPQDSAIKERLYFLLIGAALLLSFSRSAWIAALVMLLSAIWLLFPRRTAMNVFGGFAVLVFGMAIASAILFPGAFVRSASSRDHFLRPLSAIQSMIAHPFGQGLGAAGPASNRTSDACVHLEEGADASWAADRPDLCVFVADQQVQPTNRVCRCPFLTENWYLQIGVELGFLGLLLFLWLVVMVLTKLFAVSGKSVTQRTAALTFLGLSIAGLFLHAWEDGAVAYTLWLLAAVAITSATAKTRPESAS